MMKKRFIALILAAVFMLLVLCSCGEKGYSPEYAVPRVDGGKTIVKDSGIEEIGGESALYGEGGDPDAPSTVPSYSEMFAPDVAYKADGMDVISGYFDTPGVIVVPELPDKPAEDIQTAPGTLTAGRWNDNNNFDFWKSVLNRNDWYAIAETWGLFASHRAAFRLVGSEGRLIKNAAVTAYDEEGNRLGAAVTDSYGMAYVYYDVEKGSSETVAARYAYSFTLDGREYTGGGDVASDATVTEITVQLLSSGYGAKKLDLMFVIDTTGSMGDELRYIQTELADVIETVRSRFEQNVSVRLSVNFYRDHGDTYVVKSNGFTTDIDAAVAELAKQYSDGGGDYPEAVDEGLEDAVKNHDWDGDAVKLMFFVLDAPPHSDRSGTPERIRENAIVAAESGIRIIPVASSGVDTETELLMRSLAAMTGGTYVFLTDDSGVGGSHLEPTIGDYEVEKLNDVMVDLIAKYLLELDVVDLTDPEAV